MSSTSPSRASRFRLQFTLRALLCLVLACSLVCAWLAHWRAQANRERAAAKRLQEFKCNVQYGRTPWAVSLFGKDAPIPFPFSRLPAEYFEGVEKVTVDYVPETEDSPEFFGLLARLPHLKSLGLYEVQTGTHDFALLRNLPQLTELHLEGANDEQVAHFARQGNLETLILNRSVSGKSLYLLRQNPRLQNLIVDSPGIEDEDLRLIGQQLQLKGLSLKGTGVTSAGVAHLANLQNLEILSLEGSPVDETCIPVLQSFRGLHFLYLRRTNISQDEAVQLIREDVTRPYVVR
jgi:hypothetical protein